jgi:cytochrome c-type biogenesis protein CcmH
VRTVLLSLGGLVVLAALAIGILIASLEAPAPPGPPPESRRAAPSGSAGDASGGDGSSITGVVRLAAALRDRVDAGDVLFVIARQGSGPPFAVTRVLAPRFPAAYRIGPENVMTPGASLRGEFTLSARLSKTGSAGPPQPGDLEGEHPGPVVIGARGVDILLARVR